MSQSFPMTVTTSLKQGGGELMRIWAIAAVICCFFVDAAPAGETDAGSRKSISIPAQALEPALHVFAKASALQVVYKSEVVGDLRTSGTSGKTTADEALKQLLQGTGLTFRYLDSKTVTI